MNVVAFSLFGDNQKYYRGAVRNIDLAWKYYPGWVCRFYIPLNSHAGTIQPWLKIINKYGGQVHLMPDKLPPMFLRFLAYDGKPEVDRVIFRDCDSRISQREADAVKAWIESDMILHIMRDHPAHTLIPGGLFGLQARRPNWEMPLMRTLIGQWLAETKMDPNSYGSDQDFLAKKIWPMLMYSCLQHDCIEGRRKELNALPWPTPRVDWPRFVGEVVEVDANGNEYFRPGDFESVPKE